MSAKRCHTDRRRIRCVELDVKGVSEMKEAIIAAIVPALKKVTHRRFFENERGFQGEFRANLKAALGIDFPDNTVIEDEHQKRLENHGLRLRPDLIIHVPYDEKTNPSRKTGNYVVFALKKRATEKIAIEDFGKLDGMIKALDYRLGVFINIDDSKTFYENCVVDSRDRIICFAVKKDGDNIVVVRAP
ncbi:MAG: hypothetical protein A4E65_00108 [Syntrophorhabdus sp. PtaU1.Bin153]|nr:MAG: hypothetical protein A4E65_00108 [Syntrophorhabdus sp. PtaU1.Bin153]